MPREGTYVLVDTDDAEWFAPISREEAENTDAHGLRVSVGLVLPAHPRRTKKTGGR